MLETPKKQTTKDMIITYLKQFDDGVEQKQIQDALGIKQNSLSMMLKRMERKGLIEKKNMKLKSTGKGGKLHAKLIFLKDESKHTPAPKRTRTRKPTPAPPPPRVIETNDDIDEGIDFDDINKKDELVTDLETKISLLEQEKIEYEQRIENLLKLLGEAEQKEPIKLKLGDVDENIKEMLERFPDNIMIEELKIIIHGQQGQYKVSNTSRYRKPILLYHYGLEKIKGT